MAPGKSNINIGMKSADTSKYLALRKIKAINHRLQLKATLAIFIGK